LITPIPQNIGSASTTPPLLCAVSSFHPVRSSKIQKFPQGLTMFKVLKEASLNIREWVAALGGLRHSGMSLTLKIPLHSIRCRYGHTCYCNWSVLSFIYSSRLNMLDLQIPAIPSETSLGWPPRNKSNRTDAGVGRVWLRL
jgi:hypothetical protein